MKCNKALDLYFASRDDALDETGRLRLAEHLGRCPACARYVKEMEASLDALAGLPELAPSDGFEWNVKRRIHEERDRAFRRGGFAGVRGRRWVPSFAGAALAAAAAVVLVAVLVAGRLGAPEPSVRSIARTDRSEAGPGVSAADPAAYPDYATGGFAGPRMVSDNVLSIGSGSAGEEQSAFRFVASSREDSLLRENELLRRRIDGLERRMIYLQKALDRERAQRLNLSLP